MATDKAPFRIPASKGKNAWPLLSIFPGDHKESWSNYGGNGNNFRLQVGEKYFTRSGERKSFFTAAELGQLLGSWIAEAFEVELGEVFNGTTRINLYLPRGAKVWYREQGKLPEGDMIAVPPYQIDGEWVVLLSYSKKVVPVASVKPRTVPMSDCLIEPEECEGVG